MQQKPIRYCRHLQERLALRRIDGQLPEQIIRQPDRVVRDAVTGYRIALATVPYIGSEHLMMVLYEERADELVAITIHPLDERDVTSKLQSGRLDAMSLIEGQSRYDADADVLYLIAEDGPVSRSVEVAPGITIEYGEGDKIVGVEILRASRVLADKVVASLHAKQVGVL